MRRTLVQQLIEQDDDNTYFLTAGVGFGVLEPLKEKMGDRFIDVGIAEPSMISIAAGLALSGKKVYTYTMCCFYLRCVEQIRNDLCYQRTPVTMIGVGTGFDYGYHGTTHFAHEDDGIVGLLKNIDVWTPETKEDVQHYVEATKKNFDADILTPNYIRLSRFDVNTNIDDYATDSYSKDGGCSLFYR